MNISFLDNAFCKFCNLESSIKLDKHSSFESIFSIWFFAIEGSNIILPILGLTIS